MNEPILTPNVNRFVLYPIKYHDAWKMYNDSLASFWTSSEIDLHCDYIEWETKLTKDEKHFISYVLAFFASADGVVSENLAARFLNEIQILEIRCFYSFQIFMESVHQDVTVY